MSDDIKITIAGNDAQLIAVWQRQNAEILKNQKALLRMGEVGEQAAEKIGGGISGATAKAVEFGKEVVGVGTAVAGILAAAELLKAEYDALIERQKKAAETQLEAAKSQRKALQNLGTNPPPGMDAGSMERMVEDISKKTGSAQAAVWETLASALSARGNLSKEQMGEAMEFAARLSPADQEAQATTAGAIMDMMKKSPGTTVKGNAGLLFNLQNASRVKSLEKVARNLVPAVIAGQFGGQTAEESAELVSAFSQMLADPEGERSRTAALQFQAQIFQATDKQFQGKGSLKDRLEFLQSTPQGLRIKRKLIGGRGKEGDLHGEVFALPAMKALLEKDSVESRLLDEARRAITDEKTAEKDVEPFLKMIEGRPLQRQAGFARMGENVAEEGFLADIEGGRTAISAESLDKILASRGVSALDRKMAGWRFRAATMTGTEPAAEVATILRDAANIQRNPGMFRSLFGGPDEKSAKEFESIAAKFDDFGKVMERIADRPVNVQVRVDPENQTAKAGPGEAHNRRPQ